MSGKRSFIFHLSPTVSMSWRDKGVALARTMTIADGIGANFLEAPSWLDGVYSQLPSHVCVDVTQLCLHCILIVVRR